MKTRLVLFLLTLAIACLSACAQLGVPTADTFAKKLVAGYVTVQTVAESTKALYLAGKITADEARRVHAANAEALVGLDAAASMLLSDPTAADTRLTTVIVALSSLQAFLASHGATK
jgi:hypothetical protein